MSPPNVLLVVLDSTRARNCGVYGYRRETTPFLSAWTEEEAVRFEQARSPSIHSIASHTSIFTGYEVEEHNVTEHKSFVKPESTVWDSLSTNHGYDTGLFTPNVIVAQTSNLSESFDTCLGPKRAKFRLFDEGLAPLDLQGNQTRREYAREALKHDNPVRSLLNGVYKKLESRGGAHDPESEAADVYVDEFLDWIDSCSGPWAACVNLMDTHTPFEPTPEHDLWSDDAADRAREEIRNGEVPAPFTEAYWDHLEALEPLYDGTIRQADAAIERLVDALQDRGALDDTLLVITSDHGEGFGERSELESTVRLRHHSWGISEVLTHVPLVVRPPGGSDSRTVDRAATLTRFPTAVQAALGGSDPIEAFVPEDAVVSSTYRIRSPGEELELPPAERKKFFGPWQAVYRTADAGVVKYARRGDDAVELLIEDAQSAVCRAETDGGQVARTFDEFHDASVEVGAASEREMTDDVEDRLADLGYLR